MGTHLRVFTGFDIRTCPLAPASEFLKKWLSGKYILVSTCLDGQADFLNSSHIFIKKMCHKYLEICKQCNKIKRKMIFKSLNP